MAHQVEDKTRVDQKKTIDGESADAINIIKDVHLEQVNILRQLFKEEYDANEEKYDRSDYLRIMDDTTPWNCWRYLNHFQFDTKKSFENMKNTLKWRKENAINYLKNRDFAKEFWLYGPLYHCGHNKDGNMMCYVIGSMFRPSKDKVGQQFKQFLCHFLNSLDEKCPPRNKVDIVFDNANTTMVNVDIKLMKWVVGIRDHWPSRINALYVTGIPLVLRPIIRVMIAWLPIEWKDRIFCGPNEVLIESIVERHQLPTYFKGTKDEKACRLAPIDAVWSEDMELYQNSSNKKLLEQTFGFSLTDKQKEELRRLQCDYESKRSTIE